MRLESLWSLIKIKWSWFSCSLKIHVYCVNPVFIILMHFSKQYEKHDHLIFKAHKNFEMSMRTMSTGFLKYHTGIFETIWEPWSDDFQSQQKISKQHENHDHLIFKAYKDFEKFIRTMSTVLSKYHAIIKQHEKHDHLNSWHTNNLKSVWDLWTLNWHRIQEFSKLYENHDHLILMGYQDV